MLFVSLAPTLLGACANNDADTQSNRTDVSVELGEYCRSFPTSFFGDCVADADCAPSGSSCVRPDAEFIDGSRSPLTCESRQFPLNDGEYCEVNTDCDRGMCAVAGRCVAPCAGDRDCDDTQQCVDVWLKSTGDAMQSVHGCVNRYELPPGRSVTRGSANLDQLENDKTSIELLGGIAFFVIQPECGFNTLPLSLKTLGEGSTTLFNAYSVIDGDVPLSGVSLDYSPISLLIPNGPNAPIASDGYRLTMQSYKNKAPLTARYSAIELAQRGGILDIDLFYVGDFGARTTDGTLPTAVANAFDSMDAILSAAAIRIGDIRQHFVSGQVGASYSYLDIESHPASLQELMTMSAGVRGASLSIFFVHELDFGGGLLGIAGGVPGTMGMPATSASGIAIAYDSIDEHELGAIMAHEASHFLGLFHTTEIGGQSQLNPLTDTYAPPDCLSLADDGRLIVSDTEVCREALQNLMFPAAIPSVIASVPTLSEQQQWVIQRAPILR
ncbi:MAG: hypothetical protein R3A47_08505 [Polyangiales bacterium]